MSVDAPLFRLVAWHLGYGYEVPYNVNLDIKQHGIELRLQCLACGKIISRDNDACCPEAMGGMTKFVAARLQGTVSSTRFDFLLSKAMDWFKKEEEANAYR